MIEKCAKSLVGWLIKCEVIGDEEYELYVFAGYSFLVNFVPFILAVLVGGIIGHMRTGVEIIFSFMIIRKFSGGYHAKKPWICLSCSTLILCICIFVSNHIIYGYWLFFATFVAALLLVINSPIDSENKVLDEKERKVYKRVTTILVGVSVLIILACFSCGRNVTAKNIAIGVILACVLQIPYLLKRK